MLVLTRKVGEGISIGDDVKIIVMQIKGKQVRLGIKASPSTTVHREEIYQKIQDENVKASQTEKDFGDHAGDIIDKIKGNDREASALQTKPKKRKIVINNPQGGKGER